MRKLFRVRGDVSGGVMVDWTYCEGGVLLVDDRHETEGQWRVVDGFVEWKTRHNEWRKDHEVTQRAFQKFIADEIVK